MGMTRTFFGILVWISVLYLAGIYLFTKGFLLTRIEIADKSGPLCPASPGSPRTLSGTNGDSDEGYCSRQARFSKAVILLIDALRYDFAAYNSTLSQMDAAPFQNKLPILYETIRKSPEQAVLFKSLADPPTTTLQRLKGIITGSLPTFVDAGHNFASFEISEDNIVEQLIQADKRVVFMGDDTWMTLFNNKFHRAFPYPSFNVKDLHTVDEGVVAHLLPEIKKKDWDVVIAHFLGVDHCGHSLGPYHPSMGKKLMQMNGIIKSVIRSLEEDTVLFVLGDHGMTKTGDHGGDSPEELEAALFIYSPRRFIDQAFITEQKLPESVAQIDFVPTLSLLLGVSIPFSNLGSVIPPLFSLGHPSQSKHERLTSPERLQKLFHRIETYQTNAKQVHHYIETYNHIASDFPVEAHSDLTKSFFEAERRFKDLDDPLDANSKVTEEDLTELENLYRNYVLGVREMCRGVWAKFEMAFVYQGLSLVVLASVVGMVIVTVQHLANLEHLEAFLESLLWSALTWMLCALGLGVLLTAMTISPATSFVFLPCLISTIGVIFHIRNEISAIDTSKLSRYFSLSSVMQFLLVLSPLLFHSAFLTSDSNVINEGRTIVYFVQSIIVLSIIFYSLRQYEAYYSDQSRPKTSLTLRRIISSPAMKMIGFGLAMMVCVRLSSLFVSCREEQYWCTQSEFIPPLALLSSSSSIYQYRYFISIGSIAALPCLLIYYLNRQGNISGESGQVYSIRYALPFACASICMFWGLQALPEGIREETPAWQQVLFPQVTYLMIGVAVILQWASPLNLLLVERTSSPNQSDHRHGDGKAQDQQSVTRGSNVSKSSSKNRSKKSDLDHEMDSAESEPLPPLVYGLATVYSATYLHILVAMGLFIALLNSDGLAPAVLLMAVEALLFLEICAGTRRKQLAPLRAMPELYSAGFFSVPWYVVAGWSLMATQYFFATGHQATFTAIRFESAYVGFSGDFPRYLYFIPAMLVSFNTFGSQIFFAALTPLLLVWPFTRGFWVMANRSVSEQDQRGELNIHTNSAEAVRALFQIIIMFLVFQALDLVGTMVAAAILRRHLMAWSVFAPRFIFQGVAFVVVVPTLLITFLFFVNLQRSLAAWINKIPSQ